MAATSCTRTIPAPCWSAHVAVASEPGIRGFLDFLVYRKRPDATDFRWGDGSGFDKIVPDAIPLALEFQHAAAYSMRPPAHDAEPSGWPWGPLTATSLNDPTALSRLPLVRQFDGIGMIVARSDWSPGATYVTFKAGDNYWSHMHLDQGAFTIYKGGELAIDSRVGAGTWVRAEAPIGATVLALQPDADSRR